MFDQSLKKRWDGSYNPDWHLEALPLYTKGLRESPQKKDEVAVIFPVFTAMKGEGMDSRYIKSAMWSLHSWVQNTNAIDLGWKFFIFIEDDYLHPPIKEMIENSGIPEENFVVFTHRETKAERGLVAKKLNILFDETFRDFKYVFIWDADRFFARPKKDVDVFDVNPLIADGIKDYCVWLWNRKIDAGYGLERLGFYDSVVDARKAIRDFIGEEFQLVRRCNTSIMRYSPKHMDPVLLDFFDRAMDSIGDDETICLLWNLVHKKEFVALFSTWTHVGNPPGWASVISANKMDDYLGTRGQYDFLIPHVHVKEHNTDQEVRQWMEDVGVLL